MCVFIMLVLVFFTMDTEHYQLELMTFDIGGIEYGIDLFSVIQTCPVSTVTKLPNMPSYLLGIFDIHGQRVPVIDLASFDSVRIDSLNGTTGVFIVVEVNSVQLAIYSDCIRNVLSIPSNDLKSNPLCKVSRFIRGFISSNATTVSVLDLEKIIKLSGLCTNNV